MKTAITIILICLPLIAFAEEYEKEQVPDGMELIQAGTVRILVPKGARVKREGSLIIVEDLGEYVGRKFLEMEERFAKFEEKEEERRKEIEELKKALDEIQIE